MSPEAIGVWAGVLVTMLGAAIHFGGRISKLEAEIEALEKKVESLIEKFDNFDQFWRRPPTVPPERGRYGR